MTITLTTIGSRGVTLDAKPSALPEAPDGLAIHIGLHEGPLILTLTTTEAHDLAQAINAITSPAKP